MIKVVEIRPEDKKLFKKFIEFPNELYKGNTHYVPYLFGDEMDLLDPKKNASFEECKSKYFLAYKDGKIAGRVCGLIQMKSNEIRNENLRAVADLADYDESVGSYNAPVKIYVDGFTDVGAVGEYTILIELGKA